MAGSMRLVAQPDTWELRVFVGRDSLGKVKHRYVRFRGTKRQAERELARLVSEQEAKPAPIVETELKWNSTTTINDAIIAWRDNGWADLSPSTTRRYESLWKVQIKDSIGRRRIASLSSYDVEKYLRGFKDEGLAEATVRQVRSVLGRACRLARKWSNGTLPNPIADSELPSWSIESHTPVRAPSLDEVQRLLVGAQSLDPRISCILRIIVATGMRRGEACAIRWNDCDLTLGTIRIDESIVSNKGSATVKSPKTRASIRSVAIDEGTLDELLRLREIQENLAQDADLTLDANAFAFSFAPGGSTPPHPDSISHGFMKARARSQIAGDIHLHSLRHFQATALDAVISEKQKQSRLRWTNAVMARHYTDSVPDEDRRAAEHIGRLLGKGIGANVDLKEPHVGQIMDPN
ncbi:tyrosine-type recombinase/integrase [Ferrimicrobium acidiphilum]|uniref:tyrosine-type recombinase/integrase n=1 Tax=Ferrimicrobium acidiphilum TaxID=121039 RepID=UPI0023F207A4|nr:site-specific integrase [Ferrimicrobium acidiphilum]